MFKQAQDLNKLRSKHKVFAALLPYAILQEQDRQPEMLNALLNVTGVPGISLIVWRHDPGFLRTVFHEATPHAIVLVTPRVSWEWSRGDEDLVQLWVAATSVVQYTEEVAQCVVDALLWIAAAEELLPHIPVNIWSWLTKQPSLPHFCMGPTRGSHLQVIKAVRRLGAIEILKSYLLIAWSERNALSYTGFLEMCTSLREDFSGVGMGHHRVDLIQRLDQILGQVNQGVKHLQRRNPNLGEYHVQVVRGQYGRLKGILLKMNVEANSRTSFPMVMPHTQT